VTWHGLRQSGSLTIQVTVSLRLAVTSLRLTWHRDCQCQTGSLARPPVTRGLLSPGPAPGRNFKLLSVARYQNHDHDSPTRMPVITDRAAVQKARPGCHRRPGPGTADVVHSVVPRRPGAAAAVVQVDRDGSPASY
jgi:hypothetical protein